MTGFKRIMLLVLSVCFVTLQACKKQEHPNILYYLQVNNFFTQNNHYYCMTRILFAIILTTMSFFFMLNAQNPQTNVYVATNGSDANSGTLTEPFATIQHAVKVMNPGDICYIRGGTYREEVDLSGVAGESGAPITLTHYQDEEVILSGTVPITSNWTHHIGNIYKTTLSEDIWQLFVDGKHMTLARFPNALTFSDKMWDGNMARRL